MEKQQVELAGWVWIAFGYGVLLWGFIGSYHFMRYLIRRQILSVFVASLPMGFVVANMLYLRILPKWMAIPFLIVTDIWATLMTIFIILDVRQKKSLMEGKASSEDPRSKE